MLKLLYSLGTAHLPMSCMDVTVQGSQWASVSVEVQACQGISKVLALQEHVWWSKEIAGGTVVR
jgi:hypothetical protein